MQYNTVSMHLLPQVVHIKKQVDILNPVNLISCFSLRFLKNVVGGWLLFIINLIISIHVIKYLNTYKIGGLPVLKGTWRMS